MLGANLFIPFEIYPNLELCSKVRFGVCRAANGSTKR
jgi:hypothetical protein